MDCPFCHLEHEERQPLLETSHSVVILSNSRLTEGHVLVIPKRHIEKPWDLTPLERQDVFDTILFMQQRIIETFAKGCDIREHYRPFLPQSRVKVDHIHFHLHPREFEDPLYTKSQIGERELWKDLVEKERTAIIKKLHL